MSDKICITKCNISDEKDIWIYHPFLGPYQTLNTASHNDNGVCVSGQPNSYATRGKIACNKNTKIDIDLKHSMKNPIQPDDYLQFYYNMSTIDEIIEYLDQRPELNIYSKNRLFDYASYAFIKNDETKNETIFVELLDLVKKMLGIPKNDISNNTLILQIFKRKVVQKSKKYERNLLDVCIKYIDKHDKL